MVENLKQHNKASSGATREMKGALDCPSTTLCRYCEVISSVCCGTRTDNLLLPCMFWYSFYKN